MHNLTKAIKEWLNTHYGLVISDNQLSQQLPKLLITYDLNEKSLLQALDNKNKLIINATIDAFTVQESYFFRDTSLFLYLKNTLLPKLIKEKQQKGDYTLTIWSAGCCRGEEIYSIAIYLHQLLHDIRLWKINLLATDINASALVKGKNGVFTNLSLRATDAVIRHDYFTTNANSFTLKKQIRDRVNFEYANIASMDKHGLKCDLIFCRNVFIYLDENTTTAALNNFYENLQSNGILFLGPSDLVTYYPHKFHTEIVNGAYLLIKATPKKIPAVLASTPEPKLTSKIIKHQLPPLSYAAQLQKRSNLLNIIRTALDNKSYYEVLEKIDNYLSNYPETALLYRYKAEALIGLGDTATAEIYLNKSIKLDALDAISYFLQGLLAMDTKNNTAAIAALQKALYLNNHFPEAAYHLSLLYLQNHQYKQGIKLLKQSLIYVEEQNQEKAVVGASSGTMAQLMQAIKKSITYYQGLNHE